MTLRRAPARRGARRAASSRACCALDEAEHLGRVRRCRRSGRSSRPAPRSSPPRARVDAGRLGERRCGSARRPGGRPRSRRARRPSASTSSSSGASAVGVRALGGEHGDAELDREPRVAGLAPAGEQLARRAARRAAARRRRTCRRRGRAPRAGGRSGTSAVSAWRSVERAIPSCAHSSRSAGSRVPGASRPSLIAVPSRSSVSSNAVCERTGAKTRRRSRRRRGHSRSNPRTRSQSVTAASNASSSTRALLR